jgi:4-oxalocrotonate tautomerase
MPLVRIDLVQGKSEAYRKALCDGIYRAMRESFNVPENDRFMIVNEHAAANFVYAKPISTLPIPTIW